MLYSGLITKTDVPLNMRGMSQAQGCCAGCAFLDVAVQMTFQKPLGSTISKPEFGPKPNASATARELMLQPTAECELCSTRRFLVCIDVVVFQKKRPARFM